MDDELLELGAEEQETAEPVTEETEEVETAEESGAEETADEHIEPQAPDENAKYAAARREAEAKAKALKAELESRDRKYAELYGEYKNPVTNQPIRTEADYIAAIEAQRQLELEQTLQEKGLDPKILNEAIAQNPLIRQAQQVIEQAKAENGQRQLAEQIGEISKIDPSIKSLDDIAKMDTFQSFDTLVRQGYSLENAYKIANFDTLAQKKVAASKQAAINQAKGKAHLNPANEANAPDNLVDVPASELNAWRKVYPNLPMSEIKKKYNSTL